MKNDLNSMKNNEPQHIVIDGSSVKREDFAVKAKNISMRMISKSDAEFIVKIRTESKASRFISPTSHEVEDQIKWIDEYYKREVEEKDYYFIYEDDDKTSWGAIRLYDISDDGFVIGSWVSLPGGPGQISIKAWLLAVEFGFNSLNLENCFLDVRKKNVYVHFFLKFFSPKLIKEDELNYYYSFKKETYISGREKAIKLLKIEL